MLRHHVSAVAQSHFVSAHASLRSATTVFASGHAVVCYVATSNVEKQYRSYAWKMFREEGCCVTWYQNIVNSAFN